MCSSYGRCWDVLTELDYSSLSSSSASDEFVLYYVLKSDFALARADVNDALACIKQARALANNCNKKDDPASSSSDSSSSSSSSSSFTSSLTPPLLYLSGFELMLNGKIAECIDVFKQCLLLTPTDLFLLKKLQLLYFMQGDTGSMVSICRLPSVIAACESMPFFHGMMAFGLEEDDQVEEALAAAQKGLALRKDDTWCIHAFAHLYFATGEIDKGIRIIEENAQYYPHTMSFMFTHIYFHLALFYVELDQFDRVDQIFNSFIWPHPPKPASTAVATTDTTDSSASSTPSSSVAVPSMTHSYGIALTPHSFSSNDPYYPEDQNAALNLLLRWEMRAHLLPAYSAETFNSYWRSVVSYVPEEGSQLLSLYGFLQVYGIARAGFKARAKKLINSAFAQIDMTPEADKKEKLKGETA